MPALDVRILQDLVQTVGIRSKSKNHHSAMTVVSPPVRPSLGPCLPLALESRFGRGPLDHAPSPWPFRQGRVHGAVLRREGERNRNGGEGPGARVFPNRSFAELRRRLVGRVGAEYCGWRKRMVFCWQERDVLETLLLTVRATEFGLLMPGKGQTVVCLGFLRGFSSPR